MTKTFRKSFRCSEHFPAEVDQVWDVREGKKLAERWRVVRRGKANFEVEITEFFAA